MRAIKRGALLLAQGKKGFGKRYIKQFEKKVSNILERWKETAADNESKYSGQFERAVLNRFPKYQENYFAWVKDFLIPTANNLSERSLRCSKTKMKVSGQFANVRTASYYAVKNRTQKPAAEKESMRWRR